MGGIACVEVKCQHKRLKAAEENTETSIQKQTYIYIMFISCSMSLIRG